ncbi:hypothetical protein [Streptacidiphilus sp. P02-A3a]|uniref:hypothetical protein n=1 Tax=Streptacidiphilus sp. P02-A3a TaxID=2704468 RepID=UPI0015F91F53|nr:hypothetical protein [Streptacidiphilus sp. P02-A3a]QMU70070.1 hypothetical protein GXP74_19390 [Streptacidiphilus sp. P02-A3a]QMU70472.1 hypothetical protein GXP74_21960 [Streptacidiphilus sp. P02-A3a]
MLGLSRAWVDGPRPRAPGGGDATGPARWTGGTYRVVDAHGLPLALVATVAGGLPLPLPLALALAATVAGGLPLAATVAGGLPLAATVAGGLPLVATVAGGDAVTSPSSCP